MLISKVYFFNTGVIVYTTNGKAIQFFLLYKDEIYSSSLVPFTRECDEKEWKEQTFMNIFLPTLVADCENVKFQVTIKPRKFIADEIIVDITTSENICERLRNYRTFNKLVNENIADDIKFTNRICAEQKCAIDAEDNIILKRAMIELYNNDVRYHKEQKSKAMKALDSSIKAYNATFDIAIETRALVLCDVCNKHFPSENKSHSCIKTEAGEYE